MIGPAARKPIPGMAMPAAATAVAPIAPRTPPTAAPMPAPSVPFVFSFTAKWVPWVCSLSMTLMSPLGTPSAMR